MPKIKLVVFDMDNVLFDVGYFENHENVAASSWGTIWRKLNAEEEELRLKKKWSDGGYDTYTDWQNEALRVFRDLSLTKDMFYSVVNGLPFTKGAKEAVSELKKKGILTAIISGSFSELALRAKKEIGIDFPIATCSLIFEGNELKDWSVLPFDYEGKLQIFNALVNTLKIKPEECAFVCDGVNDIELAKNVGLPIAFGARKELKECCKVIVDNKDMREILGYIKDF
jgi:phosphoserine phosphatase